MNCSSNTLRICKYIETRNGIAKPQEGEFHVVVESCSMKRYYALNRNNCYCVELEHLCNEQYCVYEKEEENVSYDVDGITCGRACFDFEHCDFHQVRIINPNSCRLGTLHIEKKVMDACGNGVDSEETFYVRVRGRDFEKTVTLSPQNHYHAILEDLAFGTYEVNEKKKDDFEVSFVVDGQWKKRGIITVDGENTIIVRNRMCNGTHLLRICKWKLVNGRLVKPNYDENFTVVVKDRYACRELTLACENHFCKMLEGNRHDVFTLEEMDVDNVIYEVDGREVEEVSVRMDEDHDVRIINLENDNGNCNRERDGDSNQDCDCEQNHDCDDRTQDNCQDLDDDSCQAILHIEKWMEEDGRLYRPNQDAEFTIRIQGYRSQPYHLNDDNDFSITLDDISMGYYNIYEDVLSGYDVVFEVNGVRQEDGYVFVGDETVNVSIINRRRCNGSSKDNKIRISKRVAGRCGNDELVMPDGGSFEIYVGGASGVRYYTLTKENNYMQYIDVSDGEYTIYEVDPVNMVTYRVDGVDHTDEAVLWVRNDFHDVIVINWMDRINYII